MAHPSSPRRRVGTPGSAWPAYARPWASRRGENPADRLVLSFLRPATMYCPSARNHPDPGVTTAHSTSRRAHNDGPSLLLKSRSGDPDVVVLQGELPVRLGQVRIAHRNDQAPVLADRTALH